MDDIKSSGDLTEGPIFKSLITLAVPIIFANILQSAYQLIDTFWVGRLGQEAVAAVSISFPVIFLLISFGGGLAIAGTILVSQYEGKGDKRNVNYVSAQTMLMLLVISVFLTIIGYYASPGLMRLMGAEPDVFLGAVSYLRISFLGLIFMFAYFVFQSLMRGVGDVKTPMYLVFVTVLLNLVFDPLFIFGYGPIPGYGVSGAALATVGTQGIAAVVGIYILFSGKYGIKLSLKDMKPDINLINRMIRLGFPASIEQSTRALGLTVLTLLVASFGTVIVAAYGIGSRILSFVIIPALGLSMATSTLVGQNIGAGKVNRAEEVAKVSGWIGFISLTLVGIIIYFLAEPLSAFFIPGETEAISSSALFIKIMALSFGFMGIQQVLTGAFRGAGDTLIAMILAIVSLWVLQFPLAYVLSQDTVLAEQGIWWAFPVTNIIGAFISIAYFMKGNWKDHRVTEDVRISEQIKEESIVEEGIM
ncbi:putative efflux protein, MATE family [Methanolobus vulcani]|jgi:putative efflux protein, MATE family|uniref:Putative efflux protein, MATE family n=1 Tax=Methanolobus vulcani TaxID=38026 RepID=A0A7Z7FBT1_9EURY|nr:MATE family efflux transporter [Methanolobus vulcani]SDF32786.1 putative efflux protein, MATE family [Methanolobus vulcani]